MNKQEIENFKKLLQARKAVLLRDANHLADEALGKSKNDAATLDISNFADLGSDNFEQELELGLLEDHEKALCEITEALMRIEAGTFGTCESCEKPVPKARLKAMPHARLCLECKRKEEVLNGETH